MSSLKGKDILVIDDADDARLLARKILEVDGATVFDANSVDAAVDQLKNRVPHLILVDVEMPAKSGFDFLALKKEDIRLSAIPAIVLTGRKDSASVIKAISLGASDYILKPYRAVQVLQKVRKALKLTNFLRKVITQDGPSSATLSVSADLLKISEIGCVVESPIKLGPEDDLQLTSDFLTQLELSDVKMRSVQTPGRYLAGGRYLCEVNFIGIPREASNRIRLKIKGEK